MNGHDVEEQPTCNGIVFNQNIELNDTQTGMVAEPTDDK